MYAKQLLTVLAAVGLALSVVGPATAADLGVSVTQDGDDVTVAVTQNNSSVADADVTVDDGNGTYTAAGEYTTDDDGLVELSAPEENVTVTVTAVADNASASSTTGLVAESIVENHTENNETERDENETENNETDPFDIDLGVTVDNGTADYSNVTVNDSDPFGLYVSSFVHTIMGENVSGPMGQTVASFVTTFNPGQGPPEHAGPPENKTQGPPENVTQGPPEDKTQGPPEHAGPPENKTQGPPEDIGPWSGEDEESDEKDNEESDRRRGPPEHAGGGR
ncbi:proline-rich domain-containing protein [Halapricum desulfuricans]|uniref:Cell surface protein n=1 Tax=Halapricum desulfuricans TaxID=2841257 RepID=A0A897MZX1_9EURY|nr:hypothetical protein [Halapricum desulfuricans]QSG06212.1 Cell surface protein [Halapricum desulfuricans]